MSNPDITATDESNIIYAGFTSKDDAKLKGMSMNWVVYPATKEGRQKAIEDGYNALSIYQFSSPLENKPIPIRYGDLVLDFDAKKETVDDSGTPVGTKGDIAKSLEAVRRFVKYLNRILDVDPTTLRYWASGGKGFHVSIPSALIGSELGDVHLPRIYLKMLEEMVREVWLSEDLRDGFVRDSLKNWMKRAGKMDALCIDGNAFKMGKGQLLRLPHIKRSDGNYKIPVTWDEIEMKDASYFEELVKKDRELPLENEHPSYKRVPAFEELYLKAKESSDSIQFFRRDWIRLKHLVQNCDFVRHCGENPQQVTEPQWFEFAKLCAKLGRLGKSLFTEYSKRDTERFSDRECREKLQHASKYHATCEDIRNVFTCSKSCGVKCPTDFSRDTLAEAGNASNFLNKDDGLYYCDTTDDAAQMTRICSPLVAKASARDGKGEGWSTVFEVKDMDGLVHSCRVPYASLAGYGEDALKQLAECGLQIEPGASARKKVLLYLRVMHPKKMGKIVDRNGWSGSNGIFKYIPFDLGEQEDETDYLCLRNPTGKTTFRQSGTIEEWQNKIGRLCAGNPLVQIAVTAALAGPALRPMEHQGFGIHFYGNSSCGKSTTLAVAASVTGGEMKSWRATDNGLEGTAVEHNDCTLILDEIGQCDPDVVGQVAYMLANGQGKSRAAKTGLSRRAAEWNMLFLSSGEVTIADRAAQGFRNKPMAGHEVRVIGLRADGGSGHGVFTTLPDGMTARDFAESMAKLSKEYCGMPLYNFVACLKANEREVKEIISGYADQFKEKYAAKELTAQARRVEGHFAFLAGVGEYAVLRGILPWESGETIRAAQFCYELWLRERTSGTDIEIENICEKFLSYVRNGFYGHVDNQYPVKSMTVRMKKCYFIPRKYTTSEFCKEYQYDSLVKTLMERSLLVLTRNGNIMEQPPSNIVEGRPRGIVIAYENLYDENAHPVTVSDEEQGGKSYYSSSFNDDF